MRIQDLIQSTGRQREEMKGSGAFDSTGMLFQITPAYKELTALLNNDELLILPIRLIQ